MPRSEPMTMRTPPPRAALVASILVVEDHADSAEVLAAILEGWGYRVRIADRVDAALEMARADPPDLVLSDLGLPGRDGFDLAAAFGAERRLAHVPLVAVTSFASSDTRGSALRAGFVEAIGKPVDPVRLRAVVVALIGAGHG